MFLKLSFVVILLMAFQPEAHTCDQLKEAKELKIEHAKFLKIKKYNSGYFIEVLNTLGATSNVYSLNINHQCTNIVKIKKVDRIGTFSTTHYLPILMLGESKKLKGVSGKKYLYFNGGKNSLVEMGERPSLERIIKGNFDLVFGYSLKNNSKGIFYQLDKFNIASVNVLDYLEPHPLGRVEWIKMFGIIFNKYNESKKIFREIKKNYQELIKKTNYEGKVSVVVAQEYQGSWFVPGNKSYIKKMLKDLGVKVLPAIDSDNRLKVSREIILSSLKKANFWLPQSNQRSKKDLFQFTGLKEDSLSNLNVFNIIRKINKDGANDYWQTGVLRPDLVANDLINIFEKKHSSLIWYQEL